MIYQNLGLYFQEEIFFPYLNINEHLKFIVDIKKDKDKFNQDQVDNLLKDLDLIEHKNQECLTLYFNKFLFVINDSLFKRISPLVGASAPDIILIIVVFPASL